jgi:hypothetical protein
MTANPFDAGVAWPAGISFSSVLGGTNTAGHTVPSGTESSEGVTR